MKLTMENFPNYTLKSFLDDGEQILQISAHPFALKLKNDRRNVNIEMTIPDGTESPDQLIDNVDYAEFLAGERLSDLEISAQDFIHRPTTPWEIDAKPSHEALNDDGPKEISLIARCGFGSFDISISSEALMITPQDALGIYMADITRFLNTNGSVLS